jgi:hypothetical protein
VHAAVYGDGRVTEVIRVDCPVGLNDIRKNLLGRLLARIGNIRRDVDSEAVNPMAVGTLLLKNSSAAGWFGLHGQHGSILGQRLAAIGGHSVGQQLLRAALDFIIAVIEQPIDASGIECGRRDASGRNLLQ